MKLVGYSSALSVQPDETLAFKISSEFATYSARVIRLIHGDDRPGAPGFKYEHVPSPLDGEHKGEVQTLYPGSYVQIPYRDGLDPGDDFTVEMWIWPTMPDQAKGVLLSQAGPGGFVLSLDAGHLTFATGDDRLSLPTRVQARIWYKVTLAFDGKEGHLRLSLAPDIRSGSVPGDEQSMAIAAGFGSRADFVFGAELGAVAGGRLAPGNAYSGKIDSPKIYRQGQSDPAAAWDFAIGTDGWDVTDVSGNGHDGKAVNQPTRGATGHNWDGLETSWRHAPQQYGAIHFHDDDLGDAAWNTSLEWTIPHDLRSGIFALHVTPADPSLGDADDDYIPFFVRPRRGTRNARIALILPTFTYMAYGNERILQSSGVDPEASYAVQKEDQYIFNQRLLSLYDIHADGTGVFYSSRLRPIVNMRPRVVMQYLDYGKGSPHGLNADLYLVDWLEHFGFEFDVVTDEDLHNEGADLLSGYKAVVIPSHSEYWSFAMIQGAQDYLRAGGRMVHLSGNAMYWVTQLDQAASSIEVRRGGRCSGLSAPEPGEEYLSTSGELGGVWTYRGHAPQTWVGIGSTAETPGPGRPYDRQPDSFDPRARFIFEGVGKDEAIGDFPNLIQQYGAAGYEIDCVDTPLGTSPSTLVLATATGFSDDAQVFAERISYMDALQGRPVSQLVKCDMILLDYPNNGAVFATGSIAWCGALSYNGYENNVSLITRNVLTNFASE